MSWCWQGQKGIRSHVAAEVQPTASSVSTWASGPQPLSAKLKGVGHVLRPCHELVLSYLSVRK